MSELRWHPFLQQWVITATHRQDRTFLPPEDYCPLCPTRPGGFPTEVPAETYDVVTFENKFPSLQREPPAPAVAPDALSPVSPASGVCEVVLYSPRHHETLASMPLVRIAHLARVWQDRYRALSARPDVKYVLVFENKGEAVGVTLHHPHGQIYGFPFLPPVPERELDAFRRHRAAHGECLMCASVKGELADGRRVILEGERFVAYVPFFARYPFETYLAPRAHQPSMDAWTDEDVVDLAAVLKGLLTKFDALFSKPFPYIMVVHQAPVGGDPAESHLHFEFYPPLRSASRLKYLAGCESGGGTFINDTLAEESAAELRRVGPQSVAEVLAAEAVAVAGGQDMIPDMRAQLEHAFGEGGPVVRVASPGRVNLIGEHTDYNGGFVFPMAIDAGLQLAGRLGRGREVRLRAVDLGRSASFSLDEPLAFDQRETWSNYLRGVLWALQREGVALRGFDLAFGGDLPSGAGLSSSAALEVGTAVTLQRLLGFALSARAAGPALPGGRERLRGHEVRHHGPVRRHDGPARPRALPRLPVARAPPRAARAGRPRRGHLPQRREAQPGRLGVQPAPPGVRGRRGGAGGRAPRGERAARRDPGGAGGAAERPRPHHPPALPARGERERARPGERRGAGAGRPGPLRRPHERLARLAARRLPGELPGGRPPGGPGPPRRRGAGRAHHRAAASGAAP